MTTAPDDELVRQLEAQAARKRDAARRVAQAQLEDLRAEREHATVEFRRISSEHQHYMDKLDEAEKILLDHLQAAQGEFAEV